MFQYVKNTMGIAEKQAAKLDYIAMMADIDLSDLDDEDEEGMNYAE